MGRYSCIFPGALWGNKNPWQFWSQKSVPFLCPELCPRAAFIPKIIAAPASMLTTMDGTALQRCFLMDGPAPCRNGPDRVATLFTMHGTPLKRLLDYGQGHISTLFSMSPHQNIHYYGRARTGPSLLWAGPHRDIHYYGRVHSGPAFLWAGPHQDRTGPSLLWTGPHRDTHYYGRAHPFGPYKVISKRCEEDDLLHNAKLLSSIFTNQITLYLRPASKRCFTTHFVCIRFLRISQMFWWCKASTTDQVRVQSGRGTLPISLCMASMPAHVECKP